MKRHKRHNVDENTPLMDMSIGDMDKAFKNSIDCMLRSDGVVTEYDNDTGKGKVLCQDEKTYNFTAKRKYMKSGITVSFITGETRCYYIRREKLAVIK